MPSRPQGVGFFRFIRPIVMQFELGRTSQARRTIIRRAAGCERFAGTRLIGRELDLEPDGALVLERDYCLEGWISWKRIDLEPLTGGDLDDATAPHWTPAPSGNALLILDLITSADAVEDPGRLFSAVCPRLAIEVGVEFVWMTIRLESDPCAARSLSQRLLGAMWAGDTEVAPGLEIALRAQARPIYRQREETWVDLDLLWSSPIR